MFAALFMPFSSMYKSASSLHLLDTVAPESEVKVMRVWYTVNARWTLAPHRGKRSVVVFESGLGLGLGLWLELGSGLGLR